jgi:hypothetical protein
MKPPQSALHRTQQEGGQWEGGQPLPAIETAPQWGMGKLEAAQPQQRDGDVSTRHAGQHEQKSEVVRGNTGSPGAEDRPEEKCRTIQN